ncbi:unnamed protein product, partial [marine sediment metagenome]
EVAIPDVTAAWMLPGEDIRRRVGLGGREFLIEAFTPNAEDSTWPEMLQQMLKELCAPAIETERIHAEYGVEVIACER